MRIVHYRRIAFVLSGVENIVLNLIPNGVSASIACLWDPHAHNPPCSLKISGN